MGLVENEKDTRKKEESIEKVPAKPKRTRKPKVDKLNQMLPSQLPPKKRRQPAQTETLGMR